MPYCKRVAFLSILASVFSIGVTFFPNLNSLTSFKAPGTSSHESITRKAVLTVVKKYFSEHPYLSTSAAEMENNIINDEADLFAAQYGQGASSAKFLQAVQNIVDANARVDVDDYLKDKQAYHFGNEIFSLGNQYLVKSKAYIIMHLNKEGVEISAIRSIIGRILHTLQDFYSHSNWVENGNTVINKELGNSGIENIVVDGVRVCSDCATETCQNNILNNILKTNSLTSGYMSTKPKGKCSHGGVFDESSSIDPRGGINKDSTHASWSPHHYLHDQAASLATRATEMYLEDIRASIDDSAFKTLFNLDYGNTLAFAIDNTGSMSDEIAAVKAFTVDIVEKKANSIDRPRDFLLATFNDPTYSEVFITQNATAFINKLNAISVHGGGDCPELAFHGIREAIKGCQPGSNIYVLTDAGAKDYTLLNEVTALAKAKDIKINIMTTVTTPLCTGRRRKRSTDESTSLLLLAKKTGGQVIRVQKRELSSATVFIEETLKTNLVTLFQADALPSTSSQTHTVQIDQSLKEFTVTVSSSSLVTLTPSSDYSWSNTTTEQLTALTTLKITKVVLPRIGEWKVNVIASASYSMNVKSSSTLDISTMFVLEAGDSHPGLEVIEGKPLKGAEVIILIDVIGGQSSNSVLHNFTDIILYDAEDRTTLKTLKAQSMIHKVKYMARAILPNSDFRIGVVGTDVNGNILTRMITTVFTVVSSRVYIANPPNSSWVIYPGESLFIDVYILNAGSTSTFQLSANDTLGLTKTPSSQHLTVGFNDTTSTVLEFLAPTWLSPGTMSLVTITSSSSLDGTSNSVVFYISVDSKNPDIVPPTCNITERRGDCNGNWSQEKCQISTWQVDAVFHDDDSGVFSIQASGKGTNSTLNTGSYVTGSNDDITAKYSSNCCTPSVTLLVTDMFGNVGKCVYTFTMIQTSSNPYQTTTSDPMKTAGIEDRTTLQNDQYTSEISKHTPTMNTSNQGNLKQQSDDESNHINAAVGGASGGLVLISIVVSLMYVKFCKNKSRANIEHGYSLSREDKLNRDL